MSERLLYQASAPFAAARRVSILPAGHRARRLHGHGFIARVRAHLPDAWAACPGGASDALAAALRACVAALDYQDLNAELPVPTDENLARWVRARLAVAGGVPGLEQVGVQSTADQGADLDAAERAHVWRRFRFEAAHRLPAVPPGHPCGRMHGHGFEVILHASQDLAGRDLGVDYDHLDALWAPLHAQLHLVCLNDLPGLTNPTSELLAHWLWQQVQPRLPSLSWISVYETASAGCHFDGRHYRIWKEQRFEAALRLLQAPAGDPRRRLHGHSYLLRLHLSAPLDRVLGWTIDYGDVKERFRPVYARLDHHLLNELPGLRDPDPGQLAQWIRDQIGGVLPQLDRIDLYETPGCGASLCWGDLGPALPG
ncbi:MAG: 6-carboxytetrahydropterin synthase [Chromatiaceae bacterium]|nr:MAG: 6-carboxytetrahydropterin synthase [Chromatiaceae bacterium]